MEKKEVENELGNLLAKTLQMEDELNSLLKWMIRKWFVEKVLLCREK